jgi:hypothetical protein
MNKIAFAGIITIAGIAGLSFQSKNTFSDFSDDTVEAKELPIATNAAFKRGEKLSFRLSYGFIDAAVASLTVTDENLEFGNRSTFHVVGLGSSSGMSDWFFKVRDRYESYIDEKAMVPWMFIRRVDEGGYKFSQDYVFNQYTNKVKTEKEKVFDVTPNIQDMISAFYNARNLDLSQAKAGDIFTVDCFLDEKIFPIKIKFVGRENVKNDLGTFKCLKFRPIVQKGRIFKHEEDLNIWISDDANHIPVKGQANILFGSIKVELTDYSGLANPLAKIK